MTDPTAQARELAREIRALPFSPYYPKIDRAQALCTAALLAVEQQVWEEVEKEVAGIVQQGPLVMDWVHLLDWIRGQAQQAQAEKST